jgi:hypothetical protein
MVQHLPTVTGDGIRRSPARAYKRLQIPDFITILSKFRKFGQYVKRIFLTRATARD